MSSLSTDLEMRAKLPTDVLFEIFLQLPPDKIYNMILASERFLRIISSPPFRKDYLAKWKPRYKHLGVFICKTKDSGTFKYELCCSPSTNFPSIRADTPSIREDIKPLKLLKHYYVDSSNGRILSGHQKTGYYYLWSDHSARPRFMFPRPKVNFGRSCTSLIIEESSYKVICAEKVDFTRQVEPIFILRVEIFSSENKTWSTRELTCPEPITLHRKGTVIGGVIYWFLRSWYGAEKSSIAIYDTNSQENRVDVVKLPKESYDERAMGSSPDGCLQYGRSSKAVMEVWKLEKVNDLFQWTVRHNLSFKVSWASKTVKPSRKDAEVILAFPIRNEAHEETVPVVSGSEKGDISKKRKRRKRKKKKEMQGAPCGMSATAMSCHVFDDSGGLPFFLPHAPRTSISSKIGEKLLRHYVNS